MTHSGGKPHAVGDRGQRYEVTFFDPRENARRVFGWSDDKVVAQVMADSVENRQLAALYAAKKGDLPGHEFRGNQYTGGGGSTPADEGIAAARADAANSGPKNPNAERRFITDMGQSTPMTINGKPAGSLPRYAVWGDKGRGKPEVIETHDDLERMRSEHGVPKDRVVSIQTHKPGTK